MVQVSEINGSKSDQALGDKAVAMLDDFGVSYELKVISAHRNPDRLASYVKNCDAHVFITIAGLAAALPGAVAALTIKPVIGVPKEVRLGGLDSLLSIVQMPTGVPVATVGIDGANNASLLAVEILALGDEELREKLIEYRRKRAQA
jgi:5-(carboxyamino)imidazole ribonucleotide mutase